MSLLKYYNKEILTLTLPPDFNEEFIDIPSNTQKIIFEEDINNNIFSQFNKSIDNLPNSIKKITIDRDCQFNRELNCLPNFVEQIELPYAYAKQIKKFPTQLKKIICCQDYKYIEDFKNFLIETYCY